MRGERQVFDRITPTNSHAGDDLMIAMAMGWIPTIGTVNKFGENNNISKDTREDINDIGGTYVYPTTAIITHVYQTTDQSALRGAIVELQGLDSNWDLTVQTKALDVTNTTTLIALDTPLIRIFRIKILANVVATSNVNASNAAGTTRYAVVTTGNNQTLMAQYSIPRGYTALLTHYHTTMTLGLGKEPKGMNVRLWVADRVNGYEFQLKHSLGVQKGASGEDYWFKPYMKVNEKHDIKFDAYVYDNPGVVSVAFDMALIKN